MINGQKPWIKNIFENFLIILTLLGILLTRVVGNILDGRFGIANILSLVLAVFGLILLIVSKMDNLNKGNWLSFGSQTMSPQNRLIYNIAYVLLAIGLILTFLL